MEDFLGQICVIDKTGCKINILGTDNHELPALDVVTSLLETNQAKVDRISAKMSCFYP